MVVILTAANINPQPGGRPFSRAALDGERLGLFSAADFRLTTGRCDDCPTPKAALWYFEHELIAVPKPGIPITRTNVQPGSGDGESLQHPVLVWMAAPEAVERATLEPSGDVVVANDTARRFAIVPKIPTNQSYIDPSTVAFWTRRSLRLRGSTGVHDGKHAFVARVVWPEDARIAPEHLVLERLRDQETLTTLVRAPTHGAEQAFTARLLWERLRAEPRQWADRPVLALLLSGAQGDDDGAHAGHLSVATGTFGPNGEWADWLVNNYYPLDEESEKGILAATLPMDNYLMDLNSGQAFYRPVYVLIAVLRHPRAAERAQLALQDALHRLYCHDLLYDHATQNSTAISVDALRQIGWNIPRRSGDSFLKGVAAFAYVALRERSLKKGKQTFGYFTEERVRVFPLAAFEMAGQDLLGIVNGEAAGTGRVLTPFEQMLAEDLEALVFVRLAQVPSSRPFGTYPVASPQEYRERVPADRSKWRTAAQPSRPFPFDLKQSCTPAVAAQARK